MNAQGSINNRSLSFISDQQDFGSSWVIRDKSVNIIRCDLNAFVSNKFVCLFLKYICVKFLSSIINWGNG